MKHFCPQKYFLKKLEWLLDQAIDVEEAIKEILKQRENE